MAAPARASGVIMKLTRTVAAMAALIVAPHANATDASRLQALDAKIADAQLAREASQKVSIRRRPHAGHYCGS